MPAASRPTVRPVVFVEGVRTPFGRARPDGLYAHTRVVRAMESCTAAQLSGPR